MKRMSLVFWGIILLISWAIVSIFNYSCMADYQGIFNPKIANTASYYIPGGLNSFDMWYGFRNIGGFDYNLRGGVNNLNFNFLNQKTQTGIGQNNWLNGTSNFMPLPSASSQNYLLNQWAINGIYSNMSNFQPSSGYNTFSNSFNLLPSMGLGFSNTFNPFPLNGFSMWNIFPAYFGSGGRSGSSSAPDLTPTNNIECDVSGDIVVEVCNIGGGNAGDFYVMATDSNCSEPVNIYLSEGLARDACVSVPIPIPPEWFNPTYVVVDSDGAISERDETNNDITVICSNSTLVKGTWKGTYEIWEFDGEWSSVRTGNITMDLDQEKGKPLVTGHVTVENFWNFIEDSWENDEGYIGGLDNTSKGYISNGAVIYNYDNTIRTISIPARFHPDLTDPSDTTDDEFYWWIFRPILQNNTLTAQFASNPNSYIITPIITDDSGLEPIHLSFNISITMVKQ